jgi:hypothetical protein
MKNKINNKIKKNDLYIYSDTETLLSNNELTQLQEEEKELIKKINEKRKKEIEEQVLNKQKIRNEQLRNQLQNPLIKKIMFWK